MAASQPLTLAEFFAQPRPLKLIVTDMDGTLTQRGKFTAALLSGLERLQAAGWPVIIVTGRSAGWVSGLIHYLPIAGAMAENGGVYFSAPSTAELLSPIPDLVHHRRQLGEVFAQIQHQWPDLQASQDNPWRQTDWTFDIGSRSPQDLKGLQVACQRLGWGFTYSTVQCHIYPLGQSKAAGVQKILPHHFPSLSATEVLTIGDSPNDESLFDPQVFPHSLGVANVLDYWERLAYRPAGVTASPAVEGFLEITERLLGHLPPAPIAATPRD
ncbi:MAG TPA: HAD family phosphatase [Leptolyngbyaceae cyanobacterium M65_K2018_010]|nr:HAD family phosphatase [Leptolyngbyaceae cyanobacterium M65_K2018_010]